MDLSTQGRIARKPFALAIVAVYAAGLASQALLSGAVIARAGVWPFIIVQAGLIAAWTVLHVRRLRDAGQGAAPAIGVALVYVLAIALLLMLVAFLTNPDAVGPAADGEAPPPTLFGALLIVAILGILFSPDVGVFTTILKALIAIACLPGIVSLLFSIWAGTRPSAAPTTQP